jgi:hypothetical protein
VTVERQPPEWPEVTLGGPNEPYIDLLGDEEQLLAGPKQAVAHGTVAGIPWTLAAYVTKPVGEWWEHHGPVGPEMDFYLGFRGEHGGGSHPARIPEGTHLTMGGHFFGRFPEIMAWVGFVSERTDHVEVRLSDGRVRRVDPETAPRGFPRYFLLFPPRGPDAEVIAMDATGSVLQRERLPQIEVRPNANAGTSVNSISWPDGSPPPGWPDETREFMPGEGPRWEEDFYLHVASFPLYVVPPEAWHGLVARSGAGFHSPGHPYEVAFSYLEAAVTEPGRGFEVVNLDPEEAARFRVGDDPPLPGPLEAHHLIQSLGRFVDREAQDLFQSFPRFPLLERAGTVGIDVLGAPTPAERWLIRTQPGLVIWRLALPGTEITVGSNLPEEELLPLVSKLQRMELGSDLFHRMKQAQAASDAAWEARHHERNED